MLFDVFEKAIPAMFVFCMVLGFSFLGVIVWAVVKLVNHFAG